MTTRVATTLVSQKAPIVTGDICYNLITISTPLALLVLQSQLFFTPTAKSWLDMASHKYGQGRGQS